MTTDEPIEPKKPEGDDCQYGALGIFSKAEAEREEIVDAIKLKRYFRSNGNFV